MSQDRKVIIAATTSTDSYAWEYAAFKNVKGIDANSEI